MKLLLLVALLLAPVASLPADDARLQPIDVKADHTSLESKGTHRHAVLTGKVVARQGKLTLRAPVVEAEYGGGLAEIQKIIATQGVEIVDGTHVARGDRGEFDNAARTVTLTGDPRIWDGDNLVAGSRIVLHVDDERVECFDCSTDFNPDTIKSLKLERCPWNPVLPTLRW